GRECGIGLADRHVGCGGVWQGQLQRLAVIAIVEGDPDGGLGRREQHSATLRILADRIDWSVLREACDDRLPGPAAVARAIDVGAQVVDAHAAHRDVRGVYVEMRRVDLRYLAPGCELGWRDVRPVTAAIGAHPNVPVIGAGPEPAAIEP